jgi:hypothetical protein
MPPMRLGTPEGHAGAAERPDPASAGKHRHDDGEVVVPPRLGTPEGHAGAAERPDPASAGEHAVVPTLGMPDHHRGGSEDPDPVGRRRGRGEPDKSRRDWARTSATLVQRCAQDATPADQVSVGTTSVGLQARSSKRIVPRPPWVNATAVLPQRRKARRPSRTITSGAVANGSASAA